MDSQSTEQLLKRVERLNAIGIALSSEKDIGRLLEMILHSAKDITCADGGTLYTITPDNRLKFEYLQTDSLGLSLGRDAENAPDLESIPLYNDAGEPNLKMVAACAALNDETINIPDIYHAIGFDFSGAQAFDEKTGYQSKSLLAVPLKNHHNEIIGVLQLINAIGRDGSVAAFDENDQRLAESLASQAAVAISKTRLLEEQKELFESFIKLIATAIDEKSPYTGSHCERVPELTMMLANAAHECQQGPLKDFHMNEEGEYELQIASWLHDCGKVVTPEYIIDKGTKLETIFDRMETVNARFEILKRDAKIRFVENAIKRLADGSDIDELENIYYQELEELEEDRKFIEQANKGSEFMADEDKERVELIAARRWKDHEGEKNLLDENELYNLTIDKGTLTPEERDIINNHIVVTIKMLESLPYPKYLENVPEFAGGHHERMDGKGYPRGLTREQMSVEARIMGIADIFEALTAGDRPYKNAKTLTEALTILGKMKLDNHIDPDLFDLFIREKVYLKYAEKFLPAEQIDDVDESQIPGYAG